MKEPNTASSGGNTDWTNVSTVLSAAVLIGAEVFGAAYAGGWAMASLFGFGDWVAKAFQATFFLIGGWIMWSFISSARKIEPFTRTS